MEIPLFDDIIIIFGLAIAVIFLCQKIKIPNLVGLLITGVLAGPHGLGLIKAIENVEALADVGIILLLFTIGIEFSFRQLLHIRKSVLAGGTLQVLFTTLAALLFMFKPGWSISQSVFAGFLLSLSSTAIVLKLTQDRSEIDSPHGRNILGILIFQDIIIIPMMLFTPILAGNNDAAGQSAWLMVVKVILILLFLFISARWIAPFFLHLIARQKSRELFIISIVTACMGVAWLTSSIGLSLSLGAFMAGLIISESEYSHQALGNILPFRDVFTSIFFVSVGMLFNVQTFLHYPLAFVASALAILAGKALIAGLVVVILGFPIRTAVLAGLALAQVGEFSFILSRVGTQNQLLSSELYHLFIIVSVLTMALTPFCIAAAPWVAGNISRLPLPGRLRTGTRPEAESPREPINDHLVIIGFGVNGRNLARAAAYAGIPYVILEMNPDLVKDARLKDEPVYYGDATQLEALVQTNLEQARVVVLAISDPAATVRVTDLIHKQYPRVHIIVRTRYIQEIEPLYKAGAHDIIPEEFETSVEIFSLVLKKYLVPRVDIERFVEEVRSDGYEMLRSMSKKSPTLQDIKLHFHDAEIVTVRVEENSPVVNRSLADIDLRSLYGVSILIIQRASDTIINPSGDDLLLPQDQVVLLGSPSNINDIAFLFEEQEA